MYKKDIVYNLDSIVNYVKLNIPDIEDKFIYKSLDEIINNKQDILQDKYNRNGYLIYRGDYYIFQPFDFKDETIPILYREKPLTLKTQKIIIEDLNIEYLNKKWSY